jgi:hypothetical protein
MAGPVFGSKADSLSGGVRLWARFHFGLPQILATDLLSINSLVGGTYSKRDCSGTQHAIRWVSKLWRHWMAERERDFVNRSQETAFLDVFRVETPCRLVILLCLLAGT